MPGLIDLIGKLARIMHKDVNETFSQATDSLEAIRDFIALMGGSTGGTIIGLCPAGMAASTTTVVCSNLAGLYQDDTFNSRFVMVVIKNTNAAGAAPEYEKRDITDFNGTTASFTTEAFSANVEENDVVLILSYDVAAKVACMGVLTTSSATVPADLTRRGGDANNYWRGCTLVPISGVCAFQPRRIVAFTTGTGVFTLDPNTPFTAAPGTVPYIILNDQDQMAPTADTLNIYTPADTLGNKGDSALYIATGTASLMRYVKAILQASVVGYGTFTTSSATVPADTGRTEANDYWKGHSIMPLTGSAAGQIRPIRQYTATTDVFTLDEPFTVAPGLVTYVILKDSYPVQRLLDIFNEVNAILELTETGGSVTTDGTEQDLYRINVPAAVFKPLMLDLDCTNMQAGDMIEIRTYYRKVTGGNLIKQDDMVFSGVQDPASKVIELHPNRYGVQVTITRLLGTDRAYQFSTHYEG